VEIKEVVISIHARAIAFNVAPTTLELNGYIFAEKYGFF